MLCLLCFCEVFYWVGWGIAPRRVPFGTHHGALVLSLVGVRVVIGRLGYGSEDSALPVAPSILLCGFVEECCFLLAGELFGVEGVVTTSALDQFIMVALFGDSTIVDDEDHVR